jgi:hypothetical protein
MKIAITIIRTENFTAKAIHLGMWLWAKFRGLPVQKCFNHCEVRYAELTSGAIAKGVQKALTEYFKEIDTEQERLNQEKNKE